MTALADLLTPQTVEQAFARLLVVYQQAGFPVQSWQDGGVEKTRLLAIATVMTDLSSRYIVDIAGGGFLSYADSNWLPLTASELYQIDQNPATFTVGNLLLTNASVNPYTVNAGDVTVVFGISGRRYINNTGGVIPASGSISLSFTAEQAGQAYTEPSSSGSITLVTAYPGVTVTNPAGDYTDVGHTGVGIGTIAGSGSPIGLHQVSVRIDSTGVSGAASWSYSLDSAAYVSAGAVASLANIGGTGITITLMDGVGLGYSFVADDIYTIATPGSWITTQGADIESDAQLAQRCRNRWASLSDIPTNGFYELLVQSVPDVGAQVTQTIVLPDATVNNKVNIVVAGPLGVLPGATVDAIQAYVNARAFGTDWPVVVSPSTLAITIAGTVTINPALVAAAQAAIADEVSAYVLGVGINGTLRISGLIDVIMDCVGVIDVTGLTINGGAVNLALGSTSAFVLPVLQPLALAYVSG